MDDKRAMLGGVGGKLVQRQRQALRHVRLQRDVRPADLDLVGFAGPIRRQFLRHQSAPGRRRASANRTSSACARASALMRPSTAAT